MTSQGEELYIPVKNGFKADDAQHRRNGKAIEDFFHSPFIDSAHIRDATIDTAHINDLAVTDAKIESLTVTKLTAGELQADVLISGKMSTALTGQRVEIDSNGVRLIDSAGSPTVNLPVSGSATFSGGISIPGAAGLDAAGPVSFRNAANSMEVGSGMTLASSVSDPTAPPTISWGYEELAMTGTFSNSRQAMSYDAVGGQYIVCSYPNGTIYGIDATTGASLWGRGPHEANPPEDFLPYGAVRVGSYMWVVAKGLQQKKYLLRYPVSGNTPGTTWLKIDLQGTGVGTTDTLCGMAYDGTYLLVQQLTSAGALVVKRFNATTGTVVSTTTLTSGTGNIEPYDIEYVNTAGGLYWVSCLIGNNLYAVLCYSATPALVAANQFNLPNNTRGVAWDGTVFHTMPSGQDIIRKHTNWTSAQSQIHVGYSWFRTTGSNQSKVSPESRVAITQRARLVISAPAIPGGADNIRLYAVENGNTTPITATNWHLQTTSASTSVTLSTYNGAGGADPATNTFGAAGTPAQMSSEGATGWVLRGDGTVILPRSSSAPSPNEAGIYYDTTQKKAYVHNGTTWQALF